VLISCKEDNPPQLRQVDLDFNEQIRSRFNKIETCSASANVPESQKRCISIVLRSILKSRKGEQSWISSTQCCISICVAAHSKPAQVYVHPERLSALFVLFRIGSLRIDRNHLSVCGFHILGDRPTSLNLRLDLGNICVRGYSYSC